MNAPVARIRYWSRKALPWALLAVLVWLVVGNLHKYTQLRSGTGAPELTASLADGREFVLSEHRGEVVIVNFWSTTCPPCRKEAPVLTRTHRELQRNGGMVVGLSTDAGSLDEIAAEARELGMDYPIGRSDREILQRFQVSALPTSYVIGPDGSVARSIVGAADDQELADAIAEARN